jgi:hypothetical protein
VNGACTYLIIPNALILRRAEEGEIKMGARRSGVGDFLRLFLLAPFCRTAKDGSAKKEGQG